MLHAYGEPANIVHNISIYAWSIHSLPHLSLHPIIVLMSSIQVSKDAVKEFWGNAYPCPLEEKARFDRQFVLSAPEVLGNVGNVLPAFGPSSKCEVVDSAVNWVMFKDPEMMSSSTLESWTCWTL